jgi:PAS domain-containing protein
MAGAACGGTIAALKWGSNRSRQLQQRLSAVEAEWRLLAEHAADVIIVIDQGGQVRWVSPAVTAILGWRAEEWVRRSLDDLLTDEAGGMAAVRAAWTARGTVLRAYGFANRDEAAAAAREGRKPSRPALQNPGPQNASRGVHDCS